MPFQEDMPESGYTPEIVPPVDGGDLMAASACYIFWPFLPLILMLTARREQPYLRFHFVQSFVFGMVTTVAFAIFTIILVYFYRGVGSTESMAVGIMLVSLFVGWLLGLLFCFVWFMIFAWRAGRGDVFKILVIGPMIENWVLSGMRVL